jgi:hypothetical protein
MTIPVSGPVTLAAIQSEFGGSAPISINEYYKGGNNVLIDPAISAPNVPTSGTISFANFEGSFRVGADWDSLAALPTAMGAGQNAQASAYNGTDTFVVVGESGSPCATSSDGITWVSRRANMQAALGVTSGLVSLVWGNGQFVGTWFDCATSPDGINWTKRTSFTGKLGSQIGKSIVWDGSKYVVVGESGATATSSDGITWTTSTTISGFTGGGVGEMAYNGSVYVVVGRNSACSTSTNGTSWTSRPGLNTAMGASRIFTSITWHYNSGLFIAVGGQSGVNPIMVCATSPDGITWTKQDGLATALGNLNGATKVYSYGTFAVAASAARGKIALTDDGVTWTERSSAEIAFGSSMNVLTFVYGEPVPGSPVLIAAGSAGKAAISPGA